MSDLTYAVRAIRAARPDYDLARRYYDGEVGEVFASPSIRRKLERTSLALGLNLACRPVDAVLERLSLLAVTTPDGDASGWLADQWRRNEMGSEARDAHWSALVHGDAYLTVWPGDRLGDADIFYNSPLTTRVFYDEENPRVRRYAAKLWEPEAGGLRATLYYPDRVERWMMPSDARGKGEDDGDWEHYDGDGEWLAEHDLGEVPVFHLRTRRPYGVPEHRNAYGPQNLITKLIATLAGATDYQGYPQRWAISGATDGVEGFDDDDDETQAPRAEKSDLKAGPGELWWLRGVEEVGQFDAANVQAFLQPITAVVRYMSATTATPLHHLEPTGDAPSGESIRAAEAPLAAKVGQRQALFGAAHEAAWRCALRAAGRSGDVEIGLWWAPIQTIDDLVGWQAVQAKIDAGVPARQALLEAGYSAEQVDAWGYAENAGPGPRTAAEDDYEDKEGPGVG